MSKTPEEMAEEYCREWWGNYLVADYLKSAVKAGFLGGYQAAQQEYEAKIQELETQLENWQHNATHGDGGL